MLKFRLFCFIQIVLVFLFGFLNYIFKNVNKIKISIILLDFFSFCDIFWSGSVRFDRIRIRNTVRYGTVPVPGHVGLMVVELPGRDGGAEDGGVE